MTAEMFASPGQAAAETRVHKFPLPPETRDFRPSYSRGQYVLPAVEGGATPEAVDTAYFTRVTTGAKTLEDTSGLEKWKIRSVVEGLAMDPSDLTNLDRHGDDLRNTLEAIADAAHERNGGVRASEFGTAIHAWAEGVELGQVAWESVPPSMAPYVEAYFRRLADFNITHAVDPSGRAYVERIVYNSETGWVGTLDNIWVLADNTWVIGDKKTAKDSSIAYSWLAISIQLWNYAHADKMLSLDGTHWGTMPKVRTDMAVVAHIPSDASPAKCEMVSIDLEAGGMAAEVAYRVRQMRSAARQAIPNKHPIPREAAPKVSDSAVVAALRGLIDTCVTEDDMAQAYEAYKTSWTDELTAYANEVLARKGVQ